MLINPLPEEKNFRQVQFEIDDNFKFDENSRKFSKQVENTVDKGEIARYELSFSQCFQKACFLEVSKGVIVWEWVNTDFQILCLHLCWHILGSMVKREKYTNYNEYS